MIDFGRLAGTKAEIVAYDLERFYGALDVKGTHTEPRPAQREAMKELTARYKEKDLVLKVSTGAGKTTVGLLYLYGFMRISKEPVVFLCPTVQLVEQVLDEAARLGIEARHYPRREPYPAPECVRGEAILVCTYEKLFNARSTFARADVNLVPHAIVLDDAHAGAENIRKQFTLLIEGDAYEALLNILDAPCKKYHQTVWMDIQSEDPLALLEVPHWIWTDQKNEILELLHGHANDDSFKFVWPYLKDMLQTCRCVISGSRAEISPEILPVEFVRAFAQSPHRLFMSATLADDSMLTRELGVSATSTAHPILPPSDRGLGERMILAPSLVDPDLDRGFVMDMCVDLSRQYNVVVLTSSGMLAQDWVAKGAQYFVEDNFAEAVRSLKTPGSGVKFAVFAQRFDGVDLPDDACRVLVLDGTPAGSGLIDKMDAAMTASPGGARNRTIFRIEQGMGRPVRSHADFAVVLLVGQDLTTYVGRRDVLDAMTHDSQNQMKLCEEMAGIVRESASGNAGAAVRSVINQCLQRDPGWKDYYNVKIRDVARRTPEIDAVRIALADKEREAHAMVLNNLLVDAPTVLQKAIHEAKLDDEEQGIYLQRLSRILYLSDPAEAMKVQQGARQRNHRLSIPPALPRKPSLPGAKTVADKMSAWFTKFANPNAAVIEATRIRDALDMHQVPKKVEEAIRLLGEALGADSSRPEQEFGHGPDNLWFWGNILLVIEAKSDNQESLHKKDSGQLHDSIQWVKDAYPEFADRTIPIIAAKVAKVDNDAHFPPGTRILTQEGFDSLGHAFHQLAQKLARQGPVFMTAENVLQEMQGFRLHPDQFSNHTVVLT